MQATVYGWENSLHYVINPANQIDASVDYERAYYGHTAVGFISRNQIDWTGKSLDNTPRFAGTLAYEHRWIMDDGAFISARLQSKLSSAYFESDLGGNGNIGAGTYSPAPAQYEQPSFHRTDFNLGYTTSSGKFDVYGFVRNIENKMQMVATPIGLQYMQTDPDGVTVYVTPPRTFGVHMDWRY